MSSVRTLQVFPKPVAMTATALHDGTNAPGYQNQLEGFVEALQCGEGGGHGSFLLREWAARPARRSKSGYAPLAWMRAR